MIDFNPNEAGGGALLVGFLLVLLVRYRKPVNGLEAAMTGPKPVLYFLVVPIVGILAGLYVYIDGPDLTVPLFFLGSYLGVFGLALVLGELLPSVNPVVPRGFGYLKPLAGLRDGVAVVQTFDEEQPFEQVDFPSFRFDVFLEFGFREGLLHRFLGWSGNDRPLDATSSV